MAQLTESIVEFVGGDALSAAPPKSLRLAATGFVDAVAVMLAGRRTATTRSLLRWLDAQPTAPVARLVLGPRRASVAQATLVGAGAAHALDFDDYAYSNHVSALLVPAILADAERLGASGRAMLEAYLAGFEVWGAVMKREPDHLHSKGWHPTGLFGPIGVAAALARLRGLDAATTRNALGLAAANAGGVMDNFGTAAKPYQGARAAEAGVHCLDLAIAGIDAGAHAIDGNGGLLAALSPRGRVDLDSAADWLGVDWISARDSLNLKMHPTVGASQRTIDAAIQVHRDHAPAPAAIASIRVRTSEKHAAVMRFHRPKDALEAKFSVEFGVACGLVKGRVGLAELDDAVVSDADIRRMMACIDIDILPDDDPSYPVGAREDSIAVALDDGTVIESTPVRRFRGHGDNPMSTAELRQKFADCLAHGGVAEQHNTLFDTLIDLESLAAATELPTID